MIGSRPAARWACALAFSGILIGSDPAPAEEIRLSVTRDTWLSDVGPEADGSNGGASRLKLKSHQEMSLIDVDPAPLRGRVVTGATLHLKSAGGAILRKVTVGTVASDWTEGTATGYAPQAGASTFRRRAHPDTPWTPDGGDLCGVILGQGGSLWRNADASPPDADGRQSVAVAPIILAARVAGVSRGFLLFDDTGSEWTRKGDSFTPQPMPNRFAFSRDQNPASAPYFTVNLGPEDRTPPPRPTPSRITSDVADLPAGEAFVSWGTPRDLGPAGTIGFVVNLLEGRPAPRYLIPPATGPGDRVRMHLRDLGLKPGANVALSISAVDGAGNIGPETRTVVRVSDRAARPLPGGDPPSPAATAPPPTLGGVPVAIVDELDKHGGRGGSDLIPPAGPGYLSANHLWDAGARRIVLHAARNEFVGFQVIFLGDVRGLRADLTFGDPPNIRAEIGRVELVDTGRGPLPDPVVPLSGPVDLAGGGSLYVEVYVPHAVTPGTVRGKLTLRTASEALALDVSLTIRDFDLPDFLSFLPEMNAYGLPDDERAFYRLAHRHRTVINRVPYSQRGEIPPGLAPGLKGGKLDWTDWDRRFGPYLDGSAFADLPRRGIPIECFYLPLHENWPSPIEGNYNGDYWADRAFTPGYRRAFVDIARRFAEHCDDRGWTETIFQGFLNNKVDFKAGPRGWAGGSSPWLLDEPASFQDFWALRYFGSAFHEGVALARADGHGRAKMAFRADISRPQWQRDALDGILDYNVVGGEIRNRLRMVGDRKRDQGQFVLEYGGSNRVDESNVQPAAWCLDAWTLGADGVVPWQTIGNADSWRKADELSLFYPGRPGRDPGPVPSLRLKAYRRGQQDVEYLTLLALAEGEPRWAVAARVREALHLQGERRVEGAEDAGSIRYGRLRPRDLWALRQRVGQALADAHPVPLRRAVDWRPAPRGPTARGGTP